MSDTSSSNQLLQQIAHDMYKIHGCCYGPGDAGILGGLYGWFGLITFNVSRRVRMVLRWDLWKKTSPRLQVRNGIFGRWADLEYSEHPTLWRESAKKLHDVVIVQPAMEVLAKRERQAGRRQNIVGRFLHREVAK